MTLSEIAWTREVVGRKIQCVNRRLSRYHRRAYTHEMSRVSQIQQSHRCLATPLAQTDVTLERAARILIVDDERDLVEALCRILKLEGFSTLGVASGPLALEALRAAA